MSIYTVSIFCKLFYGYSFLDDRGPVVMNSGWDCFVQREGIVELLLTFLRKSERALFLCMTE